MEGPVVHSRIPQHNHWMLCNQVTTSTHWPTIPWPFFGHLPPQNKNWQTFILQVKLQDQDTNKIP